jgi:hypothetical protein
MRNLADGKPVNEFRYRSGDLSGALASEFNRLIEAVRSNSLDEERNEDFGLATDDSQCDRQADQAAQGHAVSSR